MPIQFNPSTQRVLYNPATNRVLRILDSCEDCPPDMTPDGMKVTWAGILCCPGVGNCGSTWGTCHTRIMVMSLGIGWNGEAVLDQGAVIQQTSIGDFYRWPPSSNPCRWGNIIYDDFGSFDEYALDSCAGGVLGTCNIFVRAVEVKVMGSPAMATELIIRLGYYGYYGGESHAGILQIFRSQKNPPFENDDCFPWGVPLITDYQCDVDPHSEVCAGEGTAIITKV